MTRADIFSEIQRKRSFLCVGLDTDPRRLPAPLAGSEEGVMAFNRAIIDATAPYAVCFKPNLAFYEERGAAGMADFEATCQYIRDRYPEILILADAKRGDIGNTSALYARAFFERELADGVTLSPYMGRDTVEPFLKYPGKWSVILALTSNPSADDFEMQRLADGRPLYQLVLETARNGGTEENTMFVIGATKAFILSEVRKIVPEHFLLVPGVGAQGGSLHDTAAFGMSPQCGLLVNSSRGILYADSSERFAEAAAAKAAEMQQEMDQLLKTYL